MERTKSIGDLECLLAGVRLGDQQFEIDAEPPRIDRVERMLGISANAAALLRRDDVQSERGLARGFRADP